MLACRTKRRAPQSHSFARRANIDFFLSFADFHSLTRRTSPEKDELLVVYAQVYPYLLPETKDAAN